MSQNVFQPWNGCFEFINWYKTPYYIKEDKNISSPLCVSSIMVTLRVDSGFFRLDKTRQKPSKSTPRVTMQLLIDKEGEIWYILAFLSQLAYLRSCDGR